jgi:hypothetical protein
VTVLKLFSFSTTVCFPLVFVACKFDNSRAKIEEEEKKTIFRITGFPSMPYLISRFVTPARNRLLFNILNFFFLLKFFVLYGNVDGF